MLSTALHVLAFLVGLYIIYLTLLSAIRTLVVPHSSRDRIAKLVFHLTRKGFDFAMLFARTYKARDKRLAFYAPVALLVLMVSWLLLVTLGYSCLYWAVGTNAWGDAFATSGSSLLTLGIRNTATFFATNLAFLEASIGLILIALLIAYLPTMYGTFSRREAAVTMLEVRAGSPPSAVELLLRYQRIHGLEKLGPLWEKWEEWFVELEETHTSLAALSFFRSPKPNRSWVTAAGAILDAASMTRATLEIPLDMRADLCIRAGFLALRNIADFFEVRYDATPDHHSPISVTRAEFDSAYDQLVAGGLPVRADRDAAWHDFAGWRVNYDTVLVVLCHMVDAPKAPWSSDRKLVNGRVFAPARDNEHLHEPMLGQ